MKYQLIAAVLFLGMITGFGKIVMDEMKSANQLPKGKVEVKCLDKDGKARFFRVNGANVNQEKVCEAAMLAFQSK